MKKIITLVMLAAISLVNAQAFKGKDDFKAQVGLNIVKGANGIHLSGDYGIGENMSVGASITYLLGFSGGIQVADVPFKDKIDVKARFNANIGNVLKIDDKLDIYPGLSLGLHDFGGHLGARYFFTDGFGVYTEIGYPLAPYDSNREKLFSTNIGVSFNL
jgi:hypothetical protein